MNWFTAVGAEAFRLPPPPACTLAARLRTALVSVADHPDRVRPQDPWQRRCPSVRGCLGSALRSRPTIYA